MGCVSRIWLGGNHIQKGNTSTSEATAVTAIPSPRIQPLEFGILRSRYFHIINNFREQMTSTDRIQVLNGAALLGRFVWISPKLLAVGRPAKFDVGQLYTAHNSKNAYHLMTCLIHSSISYLVQDNWHEELLKLTRMKSYRRFEWQRQLCRWWSYL